MTERQPPAYIAFIGLSLLFSILAVVTLLPRAAASKPNVLGYRSVCSFAPAASAVCGLLAGITCTIRNRVVSRRAASMRYRPLIVPLCVGVVLVAIAAVFGMRYTGVQAEYGRVIRDSDFQGGPLSGASDGTRSATVTQGDMSATVEVTVSSGRVSGIRLLDGGDFERAAAEGIFSAVTSAQSTLVDSVSGATASSRLLLRAIHEAAGGG